MRAALAGVDSQMIEDRGVKIPGLPFVFLATVHADNTAKRPRRQTRGTKQLTAATGLAAGARGRGVRGPAAEGTRVGRAGQLAIERSASGFREPRRVRLH